MIGKLVTVGVQCTDLEASKQFYVEKLGLKVLAAGEGWATLDAGGTSITLWQGPKAAITLGFDGAGLAEIKAGLEAAGINPGGLAQHPGGVHYNVFDPDGNRIMLAGK